MARHEVMLTVPPAPIAGDRWTDPDTWTQRVYTGTIWTTDSPPSATIVVAASDSTEPWKASYNVALGRLLICDGVADDIEIQAAIDALPGGKGRVLLTEGFYYFDDAGITISGECIDFRGMLGTHIEFRANPTVETYLITVSMTTGKKLCTISGVELGQAAYANSGGIYLTDGNLNVLDCSIHHLGKCGIKHTEKTIISNTRISSCGEYGISIYDNTLISNCSIITCVSGAIMVFNFNNTIVGCRLEGGASTVFISGEVMMSNNTITGDHGGRCVAVSAGAFGIISGNRIFARGGVIPDKGINVSTNVPIVISNNEITHCVNGIVLAVAGVAPNVLVHDNNLYGNTTNISITNGSGYDIKGNIGYIASGEIRGIAGSLIAGIANAIGFTWHNLESQDILIKKVVIEITTAGGTVGSHLDAGIADDAAGTNRGTEFFDDLLLNTPQIDDAWVGGDGGTQVKWVVCQDSVSATDGWVVGQILDANAASLVGKYYIEYMGR